MGDATPKSEVEKPARGEHRQGAGKGATALSRGDGAFISPRSSLLKGAIKHLYRRARGSEASPRLFQGLSEPPSTCLSATTAVTLGKSLHALRFVFSTIK